MHTLGNSTHRQNPSYTPSGLIPEKRWRLLSALQYPANQLFLKEERTSPEDDRDFCYNFIFFIKKAEENVRATHALEH